MFRCHDCLTYAHHEREKKMLPSFQYSGTPEMDCVHRNQLVWKTFSLQGSTDRNAQKVHMDQSLCCVQVQRGKQVKAAWVDSATLERLLLTVFMIAGRTLGTAFPCGSSNHC